MTTPANTKFGGVPIRVAIPPIEALYAIASIRVLPKTIFSFSIVFGLSLSCEIIAKPTGKIITAVAVFEIHIERNAVAIIKPNIIFDFFVPTILMMFKAILLCNFHFSMAIAKINPPINKNTNL